MLIRVKGGARRVRDVCESGVKWLFLREDCACVERGVGSVRKGLEVGRAAVTIAAMSAGVLVVSILLAVALIQAVVWTLVVRSMRRNFAAQKAALEAELAKNPDEHVLRGPVRARIRRGHVDTRCMLVLTDQRLFATCAPPSSFLLSELNTVKSNTWFHGEYRGGLEWMIITTVNDDEIGFVCLDGDSGWPNAVREAIPQRNSLALGINMLASNASSHE